MSTGTFYAGTSLDLQLSSCAAPAPALAANGGRAGGKSSGMSVASRRGSGCGTAGEGARRPAVAPLPAAGNGSTCARDGRAGDAQAASAMEPAMQTRPIALLLMAAGVASEHTPSLPRASATAALVIQVFMTSSCRITHDASCRMPVHRYRTYNRSSVAADGSRKVAVRSTQGIPSANKHLSVSLTGVRRVSCKGGSRVAVQNTSQREPERRPRVH